MASKLAAGVLMMTPAFVGTWAYFKYDDNTTWRESFKDNARFWGQIGALWVASASCALGLAHVVWSVEDVIRPEYCHIH